MPATPARQRLFLALAAVLMQSAWAAETEPSSKPDKKPRELRAVQVSASLTPEDASKVPAGVTIIDRADMPAAAATAIENLRGATGAFVQQTTPGQSAVIVRGMKGSEVLHLVDGFRLNSAIFRNAPNQYFSLVDGQALQRIELLRGPGAAIYGSDGMGGVVQMFTHAPESGFLDNGLRHQARVRYGSADSQRLLHYGLTAGNARGELDLNLTHQQFGLRRTGDGGTRPFTDFESRAANLRASYQPNEHHTLHVSVQHAEQPETFRYDELVPGYGQTQASADVALFEPQSRRFLQFQHRYEAELPFADRIDWQIGQQRIVDDRRSRDRGSNNEAREFNTDRLDGVLVNAGKRLNDHHELRYGLEFYRDRVRSERRNRNLLSQAESSATPRFPDDARQDSSAAYLLSDWRPTDRFDVMASLRLNRFALDVPASSGRPGVAIDDSALTGQVGLTYAINDENRLVFNLGRGFRSPNVFDVGQFGDRPGNRFAQPNADLGPETVNSLDLGFKHASDRFEAEAFLWQSRFSDRITSVFTGEITASGRRVVQNVNLARAELYGLEAGGRWFTDADWTFSASLNYTRGEERLATDAGLTPADRVPPLMARIGAEWQWNDRWSFNTSLLAADQQDRLSERDRTDPRIDPEGTAGFGRVDLGARYRLSDQWQVEARVENLFDNSYREHGSGIDAPGRNLLIGFDFGL